MNELAESLLCVKSGELCFSMNEVVERRVTSFVQGRSVGAVGHLSTLRFLPREAKTHSHTAMPWLHSRPPSSLARAHLTE